MLSQIWETGRILFREHCVRIGFAGFKVFGHVADRFSDLFFVFFKRFLCQITNFQGQFRSAGVPR